MGSDSFEDLERRLALVPRRGAPPALRAAVLDDVHRELAAARWDRRLARAAAGLLAVGIGMNAAVAWWPERSGESQLITGPTEESLIRLAVNVAEATDAQTGRRYARHVATLAGRTLSGDEAAAIDAAVSGRVSPAVQNNFNEG